MRSDLFLWCRVLERAEIDIDAGESYTKHVAFCVSNHCGFWDVDHWFLSLNTRMEVRWEITRLKAVSVPSACFAGCVTLDRCMPR